MKLLFSLLIVSFFLGCSIKPIEELTSKNSNFNDILECRRFDKLFKERYQACNEDSDCYEIPMPRAPDCYVPFSGNIAEKEKMSDASKKCRDLYRDDTYCDAPTPGRPVCQKNRCKMESSL